MQVADTILALEDAGGLQLDLLGSEALEQPTALAEEDGNDVELELLQHPGCEREPGHAGAVNEHVLVARRFLRSGHRGRDVVHVADGRPGTPDEPPGSLPDHSQSCRRSPPSPRPFSGLSFGPAMNPSSDMDM